MKALTKRVLSCSFFILISLIVMCNFLNATEKQKNKYSLEKGKEIYSTGNIEKTIIYFENALRVDKKDTNIKNFLVEILKNEGNKYRDEGNDLKALVFLKKASKLVPNDEDLNQLCWSIEDEVTLPRLAVSFQSSIDQLNNNLNNNSQKAILVNGTILGGVLLVILVVLVPLILRKEKGKEKNNIEPAATDKTLQALLEEWTKLRTNIQSRDDFYKKQQEDMIKMMQEENMIVSEASAKLATKQSFTIKEMIADRNPYIRARGIEVLGEELVAEKDSGIVERLLKPFLKDENNRVRANAAKALFPHNKEEALKTLEDMAKSKDIWMRASAAWVLGEIGGSEATKILLSLLEDPDSNVQKRVFKSLVLVRTKKEKSSAKEEPANK